MEDIPVESSVGLHSIHPPPTLQQVTSSEFQLQQQQQHRQQQREADEQFIQQAEILASTMQVLASQPPSPSLVASSTHQVRMPQDSTDSDEEETSSGNSRRVRRRLMDSTSNQQRSVNDHASALRASSHSSSFSINDRRKGSSKGSGLSHHVIEEEPSEGEEESDYEEPLVTPTRSRQRPHFSGNHRPDLSLDGPYIKDTTAAAATISSPPRPRRSPLKHTSFTSPSSAVASSNFHSPLRPSSRAIAAAGGSGSSATSQKSQKKKPQAAAAAAAATPPDSGSGRTTDDGGKGLRHFSLKVCEAVKARHRTTYAQVADEVVDEMIAAPLIDSNGALVNDDGSVINPPPGGGAIIERGYIGKRGGKVDEKNVRRRVYDALNVLMAVGAISKENKDIQWIGLPDQMAEEIQTLKHARKTYQDRITRKRKQLSDLLVQQVCLKNLIEHNQKRTALAPNTENAAAAAAASSSSQQALGAQNAAATVISASSVAASPVRPTRSHSSTGAAAAAAASSSLPPASPLRAKPPIVPRPQHSSGNSVTSPVKPNVPAHMQSRYAPMLLSPVHSRQHSPVVARQHPGLPNPAITSTQQHHHLAAPGSSGGSVVQSPQKPHHHPHSLLYNHSHGSISGSSAAKANNAAAAAATAGGGSDTASELHTSSPSLALPFLVLYTHQDNIVHVQQTDEREVVDITMGGSFQILEFWDLLRSLNLHLVQTWDLPRFIGSRELCAFYPRDALLNSESDPKTKAVVVGGPERLQQRRGSNSGLPPVASSSSVSRRPSLTHESTFTPSLTQSDPLVAAAAAVMAASQSMQPPLRASSSSSSSSAMQIDSGAGVKHE